MSKKPTTISSIPDIATAIGGGHGTVPAWTRPDLVIAAPGGIGSHTPANAVYSAGNTTALIAGQDLQHTVQANHATVAKDGLIVYTYGKASNASKPNTETGIALHAASGNVNTQSQQGATKLTADKSITVASTTAMVQITAPKHVLLTAAGAAIEIKGGNITLKGPGKVEFKASMKELKGPASASATLHLQELAGFDGTRSKQFALYSLEGNALAGAAVTVFDATTKQVLWKGDVPASGVTTMDVKEAPQDYMALMGYDAWSSEFEDLDNKTATEADDAFVDSDPSDEDGREEEAQWQGVDRGE
jgi:type VI secretion system secreted protein VgrG